MIYGRSDATINRQGVRMGTSEIYRAAGPWTRWSTRSSVDIPRGASPPTGELWMWLFVVLRAGVTLDDELKAQIKRAHPRGLLAAARARTRCSQIEEVPRTLSGKVLEVPVKRILMGAAPRDAASVDSLANPRALDYFVELAETLDGLETSDRAETRVRGPYRPPTVGRRRAVKRGC